MNFSEILNNKVNELAYAYSGNYDFGNLNYIGKESIISQRGVKILYKGTFRGSKIYVGKYVEIKNYILLLEDYIEEIPNSDIKINRYKVIGAMFVKYLTSYAKLGYKLVREVKGVEIAKDYRFKGYGKFLYSVLVNELNWTLIGDLEQYEGARRLWVSLSNDPNFIVDVVDSSTGTIFEKDVKITDIFDERIWVRIENKFKDSRVGKFHRLVLTKVEI